MEAERKTNSRRIISPEPLLRALALFYAPYAVCLAIVGCCIALEGFGADAMSGMIALFSNDAPFPFLWLLFAPPPRSGRLSSRRAGIIFPPCSGKNCRRRRRPCRY